MKKKLLKQHGITLIELLIVISLTGLIFGLGIYPMLSQLRMTKAERTEITLFDDANLAVNYITKDAMRAELANDTTPNEITFTINAASLIGTDPTLRTLHTVRYYVAGTINEELRREHKDELDATQSDIVITNKLDTTTPPTFNIDPLNNPAGRQFHRLTCSLSFQDPDDTDITTVRTFEVMLRCRDARL